MIRMMLRNWVLFFPVCFVVCTVNLTDQGGTDYPNSKVVGGAIFTADSLPAVQTEVKLIPSSFNVLLDSPSKIRLDTTDTAGRYQFTNVIPGTYTLLAQDLHSTLRALISGVPADTDTVTEAPRMVLKETGTIRYNSLSNDIADSSFIFILGTDLSSPVSASSGVAVLDSVPSVQLPDLYYAPNLIDSPQLVIDTLTMSPAETIMLTNSLWKYSQQLSINTTASGANISGTVTRFPLLVRLDENNFDFSQAHVDGKDIRFTDKNNMLLPYEIEEWDPANHIKADVWVLLDTILGQNSSQYITAYWGNPAAEDNENAQAVFDTADGLCGVWHLDKSATGVGNKEIYQDATGNCLHGDDYVSEPDTIGLIGHAQNFDGVDDYIDLLNPQKLAGTGHSTISAWVRTAWTPDTATDQHRYIVDKYEHSADDYRRGYSLYLHFEQDYYKLRSALYCSDDGSDGIVQSAPLAGAGWKLFTATFDGATMMLYENGIQVASTSWNTTCLQSSSPVSIGRRYDNEDSAGGFFMGTLDEVRIASKAFSADFIKLCYETQKQGSIVVQMRK